MISYLNMFNNQILQMFSVCLIFTDNREKNHNFCIVLELLHYSIKNTGICFPEGNNGQLYFIGFVTIQDFVHVVHYLMCRINTSDFVFIDIFIFLSSPLYHFNIFRSKILSPSAFLLFSFLFLQFRLFLFYLMLFLNNYFTALFSIQLGMQQSVHCIKRPAKQINIDMGHKMNIFLSVINENMLNFNPIEYKQNFWLIST